MDRKSHRKLNVTVPQPSTLPGSDRIPSRPIRTEGQTMVTEKELSKLPDSEIECLRCGERMKDVGALQFHKAGLAVADLIHRMKFEARVCPKCGKTELFF